MRKNPKTIESISEEMGGECIGSRIRFLNRVITNIYDDALRPLEITTNQMNILIAMFLKGFSTPGEIASYLHMEKSTVSRNLNRMEKRGWLEILAGEDARSQRLRVTSKGKKVIEKSWPLWKSAQKKAKQVLGECGADSVCDTADELWSKQSRS